MEHHVPSTSLGISFREEILRRLEARNATIRPWAAIFKNYSRISEELAKVRKRFDHRDRTNHVDSYATSSPSEELKQLREELAEVYKQKSRNDQSLIEANKRLDKYEASLTTVTKERDKLIQENKKLCARISELECTLKKTIDDKQTLYDEWIALSALLKTKTNELLQLKEDRLVLINKIRDLNEQHANLFNTEVDLQQERQQRKIREEIARACEDTSKDEKINQSLLQTNLPTGDVVYGDVIPQEVVFKTEANDGEVYDILWLSTDMFASGGSDKRVRLWKIDQRTRPIKTNTLVGCNHAVTRLDFNAESRLLLGASNDHGVRLWNVDNLRLVTSFMGHMDKVTSARFLSCTQVVSGSNDRVIKTMGRQESKMCAFCFPRIDYT
ncbi:hypothetical protein KIN20_003173 [Parelaphostrongylus tenuis]|uniref:Autophagy-related protein 16 domain-containing protein n=1 Tax=Parelaphostrongylus tenuis TaxID=148309 RepID=A0AAD5MHW1_PARTN|nr:hypothetical protein KIN20_003173 [Parelaphostrongylus tenuis]